MVRIFTDTARLAYLPNAEYGWSHIPGNRFTATTERQRVEISINSHGFRNDEISDTKPAGTNRILVLGDSFTEALQVARSDAFPERLERLLTASHPSDDQRFEVLNAGVSGYGTDNALLFFRHRGAEYSPDRVVLAFYIGNDIRNNWFELENIDVGGFRKPYFSLEAGGLRLHEYPFESHNSLKTKAKVFLNRHFRLYSFAREVRDRLRHAQHAAGEDADGNEGKLPLDLSLFKQPLSAEWNYAMEITKALLVQLENEVSRVGAELTVVLIPTQFQVHDEYWNFLQARHPVMAASKWDREYPNRELVNFCQTQGIDVLDLLPEFRSLGSASEADLYLAVDQHWNKEGHRIASELIADWLLSKDSWRGNEPPRNLPLLPSG